MLQPWKTLDVKEVFKTPWFRIAQHKVELPDGKVYDNYFVREHQNVVMIFPMTEDGKVVMVKEFKYGAKTVIETLPAGMMEDGETPEKSARRELVEETGYVPNSMEHIKTFLIDPTGCSSQIHIFFATGCVCKYQQSLDPTEEIEVFTVSIDELRKKVQSNDISTLTTVGAIYYVLDAKF